MFNFFFSAWGYRQFIFSSIRAEFKNRFIRSRLGGLWCVIHPLSQVLIYALILSRLMAAKIPGIDNRFAYAIYLCAGVSAWGLFVEIVTRSMTIFIDNGNLIKKIAFPKITLPLIMLGSALINHALLLLAMLVVFAILGHMPGPALLWLPLPIVVSLSLALGIGLALGVLNVFLRDIGQLVTIVLQILFWFTPIVYFISIIPESLRRFLVLSPIYPVVVAYQDVLVYGRAPDLGGLLTVFTISLALLAFALTLFRKAGADMMDVL